MRPNHTTLCVLISGRDPCSGLKCFEINTICTQPDPNTRDLHCTPAPNPGCSPDKCPPWEECVETWIPNCQFCSPIIECVEGNRITMSCIV